MKSVIFFNLLIFSVIANGYDFHKLYSGGSWKKELHKKGFDVYSMEIPGSDLLAFKVQGELNAPLDQIMYSLRSVKDSTEWTPDLEVKKTVEDISDLEAVTYSISNMTWPVQDRDFVLHNKLYHDKKKNLIYVISKSVKHEKFPPKEEDNVRAWIGYSNIGLKPLSLKKTYVEWTLFGDPKGALPSWLVNFFQKKFAIGFFKALEERASKTNFKLRPELEKTYKRVVTIMAERKEKIVKK